MNWIPLDNLSLLEQIKQESENEVVLIFKHSTRCSISSTALSRLDRSWKDEDTSLPSKLYFLDLIEHRDISSQIATEFGVVHQSPQVLLIKNKKAIYDASHMMINVSGIKSATT